MNPATIAFFATALVTILGGLGTLVLRNLLHAGLSLGLCLTGVAGLYLFLQAEYLAVIQVLVYVGGVLVLILLGVFLSRDLRGATQRVGAWTWAMGLLIAGLVLQLLLRLVLNAPGTVASGTTTSLPAIDALGSSASPANTTLGDLFLGPMLIPFLVLAVLLTVVAVAAVALVRQHQESDAEDQVPAGTLPADTLTTGDLPVQSPTEPTHG